MCKNIVRYSRLGDSYNPFYDEYSLYDTKGYYDYGTEVPLSLSFI